MKTIAVICLVIFTMNLVINLILIFQGFSSDLFSAISGWFCADLWVLIALRKMD